MIGYLVSRQHLNWIPSIRIWLPASPLAPRGFHRPDPETVHLEVEAPARKPEQPRGLGNIARCPMQRILDHFALELLHRNRQRRPPRSRAGHPVLALVADLEDG